MFLSLFINDLRVSNSSANSVPTDEIHTITELFRKEIPEEQQHKGFTMDDDIIMIRRLDPNQALRTRIWLVAPFEADSGSLDHMQRSGVAYCSLNDMDRVRIFRFPLKWQNPDDFWNGVHEGFGDKNERYFRFKPKNANSRTLNYSRGGFYE